MEALGYPYVISRARQVQGVGPMHLKGMPVLLTTAEGWDLWLRAPWSEVGLFALAENGDQNQRATGTCGLSATRLST
jgi:hypothetical protein